MIRHILISVFGAAALSCLAQGVGLSGTVTNKANGQKLQGVTVALAKTGLSDTTDSLGAYRLGSATGILSYRSGGPGAVSLDLRDRILWIHSGADASMRIAFFDLRGTLVARVFQGRMGQGTHAVTLPPGLPAADMLLLRLDGEGLRAVYKYIPSALSGGALIAMDRDGDGAASRSAAVPGAAKSASSGAVAAVADTLRVRRSGYKTVELPLDSYTGVHDIAMEPEGTGCVAGTLCWDFEEGRIPDGWTVYRTEFTGTLLVDGSKPHKGAFALHAKDLLGGKEGNQGGPKRTLKYALPAGFGPVLWGRVYVYTSPARPVSHAGLFNARYPRPGSPSTAVNTLDWYEFATYQQTYMGVWHPPEPPGFPEWVLQSDKQLVLDDWACLEWEFDGANGTDPEAADPRVWVDGLELSWPTKFTFSDPAGAAKPKLEKAKDFTFLETGVYLYQGLSLATNWWIDDLAVGSRRIGCN